MTFKEQKLRHEAKSSAVTLCSLPLKTKYITLSHDVVCACFSLITLSCRPVKP